MHQATIPAPPKLMDGNGSAAVRRAAWAILAIAVVGWFVRALPLIRAGAFGYPIDYDEGVYFSASALLLKGVLPYRDFVFVHPLGSLYFLAPAGWLGLLRDPAFGFAAARWLMTAVGFVNVLLLGQIAVRWAGPAAAIVAAAVYATHPEAASVERGPFLEPVLNLTCLAVAWIWLGGRLGGCTERSVHPSPPPEGEPELKSSDARTHGRGGAITSGALRRFATPGAGRAVELDSGGATSRGRWRLVICGALCGFAASIKVTGALWLVACLLSLPRRRSRGHVVVFLASAAAAWIALAAPSLIVARASFIGQVIWFHMHRPPDGTVGRLARLAAMLWSHGLLAESWLFASGLVLALVRSTNPERRAERFFTSAFLLILAGFLVSSTYWSQYNAHLAVPEAALAGYGGASLWRWAMTARTRIRLALVFVLLAFVPAWGVRRTLLASRGRSPELIALGHFLRSSVPADACLMSFEPAWSIAGGRLPDNGAGVPRLVDPYAAMLLDAARSGQSFADATQSFRDPSSQTTARAALDRCRFAIVAGRGFWQMSADTQRWFRTHFVQRFPPPGMEGIDVWERAP